MEYGRDMPLLVNMQPAGKYLGERFHRAGGVPAVLSELLRVGKIDGKALTVTGRTLGGEHRRVHRDVRPWIAKSSRLTKSRCRKRPASSCLREISSISPS